MQARPAAEARPLVADRVPTLTEVVEFLDATVRPLQQQPRPVGVVNDLSAEMLFELEQRIDSLFESRLREALAPALARAADGLIREARLELSGALRGLVDDAVTRALERRTNL